MPLYHLVYGAALYRAGKHAAAIPPLQEAVRLFGQTRSPATYLLLALAHQSLGQADQAKTWRAKAQPAADDNWVAKMSYRQLTAELDAAGKPPD